MSETEEEKVEEEKPNRKVLLVGGGEDGDDGSLGALASEIVRLFEEEEDEDGGGAAKAAWCVVRRAATDDPLSVDDDYAAVVVISSSFSAADAATAAAAAAGGTSGCRFVHVGSSPTSRVERMGGFPIWGERLARSVEDEGRAVAAFLRSAEVAAAAADAEEEEETEAADAEERDAADNENDGGDGSSARGLCTVIRPGSLHGGGGDGDGGGAVTVGAILEEVLGLYPIRALAESLPGPIGLLLDPPVSVRSVASAAFNAAVGLCDDRDVLESNDDIVMVASRRRRDGRTVSLPAGCSTTERREAMRRELKEEIVRGVAAAEGGGKGGGGGGEGEDLPTQEEEIARMERLESLLPPSARPAHDPRLDGRWRFVFTVEPDIGTGVIKSLLEDKEGGGGGGGDDDDDDAAAGQRPSLPSLRRPIDLRGVVMEIGNGRSTIDINVDVRVLGRYDLDLVLSTSLVPDASDPGGTMLREKFEGVTVGGWNVPIPDAWKRSRYLEIPYVDDDLVIARGAGREPHFLLREEEEGGRRMDDKSNTGGRAREIRV